MLTALEQGVKGGKWFSLMDKVYSLGNLESAAKEVARNGGAAGVDRVTIDYPDDRCRFESDFAWLVWVLPIQPLDDLPRPGRLDSYAAAEHPPQAAEETRTGPRVGSSALAKCLLCGAWAF
jgi:hypothetical protein